MTIKGRKIRGILKKGKVINMPVSVLKATVDSRKERLEQAKTLSRKISRQVAVSGIKASQIEKDVQQVFNEIKANRSCRIRY